MDDRALEDALDQRSAELIALRKAAVQQAAAAPSGAASAAPLQSALGRWGVAGDGSRYTLRQCRLVLVECFAWRTVTYVT